MKYTRKNGIVAYAAYAAGGKEVTDSMVRRLLFDAGDDIDDLMTSAKRI